MLFDRQPKGYCRIRGASTEANLSHFNCALPSLASLAKAAFELLGYLLAALCPLDGGRESSS